MFEKKKRMEISTPIDHLTFYIMCPLTIRESSSHYFSYYLSQNSVTTFPMVDVPKHVWRRTDMKHSVTQWQQDKGKKSTRWGSLGIEPPNSKRQGYRFLLSSWDQGPITRSLSVWPWPRSQTLPRRQPHILIVQFSIALLSLLLKWCPIWFSHLGDGLNDSHNVIIQFEITPRFISY